MKPLLLFTLLLFTRTLVAQNYTPLLKLLNQQLQLQVKTQLGDPFFQDDTMSVVKPFTIDEKRVLSFTVKKSSGYNEQQSLTYTIIEAQIPLDSIAFIGRDGSMIFESNSEVAQAKHTIVDETGKANSWEEKTSYFHLHFRGGKDGKKIRGKIIKQLAALKVNTAVGAFM